MKLVLVCWDDFGLLEVVNLIESRMGVDMWGPPNYYNIPKYQNKWAE